MLLRMSERDDTTELFGMPFSILDFDGLCRVVDQRIAANEPGFIVTPNVNIVCTFHRNKTFSQAYCRAFLWLPDGKPLIWLARLLGTRLGQKLSGSDMVPSLSAHAAAHGYPVYFFGGLPGSAEIAAQRLRQRHPHLQVAGVDCPPWGFEHDPEQNAQAIQKVRDSGAKICFVALGCPKQEIWMATHMHELGVPVCMGVGAALDFMSGKVRRAPRWVQQCGLEWVWRLAQEPRRLWRRYLVEDMMILPLFFRELLRGKRPSQAKDTGPA